MIPPEPPESAPVQPMQALANLLSAVLQQQQGINGQIGGVLQPAPGPFGHQPESGYVAPNAQMLRPVVPPQRYADFVGGPIHPPTASQRAQQAAQAAAFVAALHHLIAGRHSALPNRDPGFNRPNPGFIFPPFHPRFRPV